MPASEPVSGASARSCCWQAPWPATFLVFAGIAMRVAVRARQVTVPESGRQVDRRRHQPGVRPRPAAAHRRRRAGPIRRCRPGHVLGQDPAPGSTARRQRSVRVWVSAGAHIARAPSLLGETQRSAEIRVAQDGLIDRHRRPRSARRSIRPTSSSRRIRRRRRRPSEIRLLVNRGEDRATYVMPDLIGLNGDRAADVMRVARLPRVDHVAVRGVGHSAGRRRPADAGRRLPGASRRRRSRSR